MFFDTPLKVPHLVALGHIMMNTYIILDGFECDTISYPLFVHTAHRVVLRYTNGFSNQQRQCQKILHRQLCSIEYAW